MMKCIEDMKVSFVTLSKNPILTYCEEISTYNLATLQIKYPTAYKAIEDRGYRQVLVLSGFYNVSNHKGKTEDIELELSNNANSDIIRFRDIFIGNQYFASHNIPTHNDWKFDEKGIDISGFDKLTDICKFIKSLLLFLSICEDGKPAWHAIAYDYDNKFARLSQRSRQAFINICNRIIEVELRENEKRITELLY